MASKTNVILFNILSVTVAIILCNFLIQRLFPINNYGLKRTLGYPKETILNFTGISKKYGYFSEEHNVVTEDGYILTMFRINGRKCQGKLKRPPVILMHGLLLSADAWLDAGPNAGLAYLLADACYDLWVGNQRGNFYGRRHLRLNPDKDPEFWKFSTDEMGYYDIPATIDYVLNYTGFDKLNYVGYSQGGGTFFIMCSERPGYCEKANIFIGLAPAARQTYTNSLLLTIFLQSIRRLEEVLSIKWFHELFAKGNFCQEFLAFFCKFSFTSECICGTGISLFDSFHPGSITNETIKILFGHFPSGTSAHNMAKFGQSMKTDQFQKFDYGEARNLELYGVREPPRFNLSAMSIPFVTLYGKNDYIVHSKDVMWLVNHLPNVLEAKEISDPLWNHLDVMYSQHTKELIFPKINEYLLKYSFQINDTI